MLHVNSLVSLAERSGFESYGSFNEGDCQHDILTCLRGKFDGEVIDIWYNYHTGIASKVEVSCQFSGQVAQFKFPV